MRTHSPALVAASALGGCDMPMDLDTGYLAMDNQRCADLGFAAGSTGMAECMRTATQARADEQARLDRQMARYDAAEAAREKEKKEKQAAKNEREERVAEVMPTASRLLGMECTGSGANASCDALFSY